MEVFGDDVQKEFFSGCYRLEQVTFAEDFPLLGDIEVAFGRQTAVFWLKRRFVTFTEMRGPGKETADRCLERLAEIIIADGFSLNMAEIYLFIAWLTAGKLGNLYDGSPARVATAFQTYLAKRKEVRIRLAIEREEQKHKKAQEENEIYLSSQEYFSRMIEYWRRKGDEKMADIFRERLEEAERSQS